MAYGRDEQFFQNFFLACKCANISVEIVLRFPLKFGNGGRGDFKEADIIAFISNSVKLPIRIYPIHSVSVHLTYAKSTENIGCMLHYSVRELYRFALQYRVPGAAHHPR